MHGFDCRRLTFIFGASCAALFACAIAGTAGNRDEFQLSFAARFRDSEGHFIGGTEVRLLTGHGGKLYAGNGYREDRPGSEGPQGAQILVLDRSDARWRVDLTQQDWRDVASAVIWDGRSATVGMAELLVRAALAGFFES